MRGNGAATAPAQAFWNNGGEQAHWCHAALQAGAWLLPAPHAPEGLGMALGGSRHRRGPIVQLLWPDWGDPKGLGRAQ